MLSPRSNNTVSMVSIAPWWEGYPSEPEQIGAQRFAIRPPLFKETTALGSPSGASHFKSQPFAVAGACYKNRLRLRSITPTHLHPDVVSRTQ